MISLHKTINEHYLRKTQLYQKTNNKHWTSSYDYINKTNEDVYVYIYIEKTIWVTNSRRFSRDAPEVLDRNCGMCRIYIKIYMPGQNKKFFLVYTQTDLVRTHKILFAYMHSARMSYYFCGRDLISRRNNSCCRAV